MISAMANTEQNNEQDTKIQIGSRVDPKVFAAIESIATKDERTLSNTIERLLKQSPPVQELLEAETAGVGA